MRFENHASRGIYCVRIFWTLPKFLIICYKDVSHWNELAGLWFSQKPASLILLEFTYMFFFPKYYRVFVPKKKWIEHSNVICHNNKIKKKIKNIGAITYIQKLGYYNVFNVLFSLFLYRFWLNIPLLEYFKFLLILTIILYLSLQRKFTVNHNL